MSIKEEACHFYFTHKASAVLGIIKKEIYHTGLWDLTALCRYLQVHLFHKMFIELFRKIDGAV